MTALALLFAMHVQCFSVKVTTLPSSPVVTMCYYDGHLLGTSMTTPCGSLCDAMPPERPQVRI